MPKKTTLHEQLVSRLALVKGAHTKIARECGLSQSTLSRVSLGQCSPTLAVAEPILAWLDTNAPDSAAQVKAKRVKRTTPRNLERRKSDQKQGT